MLWQGPAGAHRVDEEYRLRVLVMAKAQRDVAQDHCHTADFSMSRRCNCVSAIS
jgi:hypothetical protein